MIDQMQGFRLSPQQKHLWHLQESDNFPYSSQCAVLIEGNLDIDTLRVALELVVSQHEILRTNFHCLHGMTIPLQVIRNNGIAWDENHNLRGCTLQEQEQFLSVLFDQVNKQQFDLVEGSPLHLSLVTLSSSKYALLISLHALCADAATLKILVQEISQSYAACLQGKELDDEPLQYADLAEWQNELLEGADTEAGRDYWRKQDFSALTKLKLPFEKQSTEQLEFQPQTQSFTIAPALLEQIYTLTQQYNISVTEFFLASWQILLARLTKQQNLSFGVAYEGRKYQELEKSIGLFTKYLPLISNIELESNFINVFHQNNKCAENIYKLQDYFTWEVIAESYQNTLRFFPVCFEFEELPGNYVAADVSFSINQLYTCIERFKIKLSCIRQNDTLNVAFHYDSNLFDLEDIKRLIAQFQTLLASVIAHPETAISQLDILSQIERQQLLDQENNTKHDYPHNNCIHQLFEEQVGKTPNKIAVIFEDQQLTYHDLNQRANKIAHYLQKQGVAPEVLVGLCVERSLDMIVGLLAILKAGGAYVPLDPALPKEGLALRLQDVQVSLIISHSSLVNNFEPMTNNKKQTTVIYLDSDWETIAQENDLNPNSKVTNQNLVYVLFTSGSTGTAKGVAIEHRQLLNYLYAIIDQLNLPAGANFALVSTFAADLGNTAIFPCLSTGGCLYVISYERATDPAALAEYCRRHPIDCLKIVPSHLASLLTSSSPRSILPRERLILGGEATSWELIEQIQKYAQDCLIFNHYGPTEATVGVLTYLVELTDHLSHYPKSQTVPLGRSIPNTQVYVLEENLQPAPIGLNGEIYIGGTNLARCYLNQPEQTAVKFIPNPFSQEKGARLYKTGDRARYLPDGRIEFLGRTDHQVKIRGFRIELGEIEAVLSLHPNVREVVVLARDSESSQKYLTAYVVPSQESPIINNELRNYMQARLPEYMVPSSFVMLKALPLTPNGKVDRQALPEPNSVRPKLEKSFAIPRTPIEEVLAGIWARVLGIEYVGIHDNFFDLGGHSLLATQVVSQVREAFQVELRLRSLFETPTVAGLAELIETTIKTGQKPQLPPIERVLRDRELPLSFAQQRLWFLDQLEPGNPFYNISRSVRLKGSLNVAALEQSLNEIVRRHEVLRTSFTDVDGHPVQKIASALNITLPIINLGELSQEEREVEGRRLASLQARQSFDLTQDALLRGTLLRLEEEDHMLVFVIHHIVADGWSTGVIIHEITALYKLFYRNKPSSLPELPVQYADFAIWQRKWLQIVQSSQMAYWKQQLGGNLPVLQLPTDRPRPAIQTFRGRKQPWQISKTLTEALKSLSQREAVTPFMTMLAAFKTLLYRYTNQADILIGSPIANRNRQEIEGLIGFFVNTLVLRTDLSGNPSFNELLQRVRQVTLDGYAHQDLPFEQLVEELQPERNLRYTPLFQVMFVLHNAPMEELKLPDLSLSPMEVEPETSLFDLTVYLRETEQGMMGLFEYNSDLFDTATIDQMQGHFQTLLEGIVANPNQHLSDLPILTATEQQQLLVDWNQTSIDYPSICIHQLFEAQVKQTPNAIAVVFEDQQLTYQELNVRANQLAHYLRSLGVEPEVLVGIGVERSLEMVIGLLGILKAGGAYVPLDPSYPKERLVFMLENSQPSVLLTQQHLVKSLPTYKAQQVVCLDSDWKLIGQESRENPLCNITCDNLAYVIYTSGSTGKPKGAMNTHKGVCNRLLWMQDAYQLTVADKVLQKTPFSFDVSVWEFFWTLMTGARLVVAQPEGHRDPNYLVNVITQQQITTIHFVPSMLQVFLQAESLKTCKCLKRVIASGEALPAQLQKRFFSYLDAELHNLYGPTEAAVDVTFWACVQQSDSEDNSTTHQKTIPIGRPIANIQIYLLDQHFNPVPVGVTGEVHIGGVGVGRGYLNRPELTALKFIPNPFSDQPNARLYKTGDLARYLPNGEIEYIGRIDNQVKLRGFRIELGEIEAVLANHPAVEQTVVLDQEDTHGNKRLVAYVVASPQYQPSEKQVSEIVPQLRHFLQEKLPDYMVPSAFVTLEALPLTPNGKVDRRSLAASGLTQVESEEILVARSTPVEEILAGIWAEILDLDQVGIHDNFFELGGHSLLATRVISQIQKVFKLKLPLHRLFDSPTVAKLATEIEKASRANSVFEAATIERISRSHELPLSFAQQRLWFLHQLEPDSGAYNSSSAVLLQGSLNVETLEKSINEIVRRHESLRTCFVVVEGLAVQRIASELIMRLPIIDIQHLTKTEHEIEVQQWGRVQTRQPFDLSNTPLIRLSLVRLGIEEHILFVTMHHIIFDAWSVGIFIREISALYEAFSTGKPSHLPELSIQYADFAVWQRQWLQKEVLETQLAYWKQQLDKLSVLQLTTDYPRPAVPSYQGATQSLVLSKTISKELKALSVKQGVTLFMMLLAAFQTLLHWYTNQDDIIVGTDIANRNRAETEDLIGFFVNQLLLRTHLGGNPTFHELLERVREVTLGAYIHQDLPFDTLVEVFNPERHLNSTPLFQVKFILQNTPIPPLELSGLTVSSLEIDKATTEFDLLLQMTDTEQGLITLLKYNTDLFKAASITRILKEFETLLNTVAKQPDIELNELKAILVEVNQQQRNAKEQEYQKTLEQKLMNSKRKLIR